jgi:hypothetical protein
MAIKSNSERQKAYRMKQKDVIYQEIAFVESRTANISPFVQFALSLQQLYENKIIGKDLIDSLIADEMDRVEKCENILVARSLRRRMEEFITKGEHFTKNENMKYYIYRNWVAEKKAVIHKANCSYCNNGKGLQKNLRGDKNGAWSKEYNTYEEALEAARLPYEGHADLEVKTCSVCLSANS